MKLPTPCKDCDTSDINKSGGALKSPRELFNMGWHYHKTGENTYMTYIDDMFFEAYLKRWPGGALQQLAESGDKKQ